jgi:hypothetical protein
MQGSRNRREELACGSFAFRRVGAVRTVIAFFHVSRQLQYHDPKPEDKQHTSLQYLCTRPTAVQHVIQAL